MANLKEIRTRISSVKTTRQVTSAMKLVAASKLKKAQDAIIHFRPFADKLHEVLTMVSSNLGQEDVESPFTVDREPEKVLIVLIASNRGLCGGFNANVSKMAVELARTVYASQWRRGNVEFMAIGKNGEKSILSAGAKVVKELHELLDDLNYEVLANWAGYLMDDFKRHRWDRIELVYNQFKNAGSQVPVVERFLPVEKNPEESDEHLNFIFEPSKAEIVNRLIPMSLKIQFYKAMLDSAAAENGARMIAMHKATDNATELIKDLTVSFNKARQAAITNQIIEVTSGADALSG